MRLQKFFSVGFEVKSLPRFIWSEPSSSSSPSGRRNRLSLWDRIEVRETLSALTLAVAICLAATSSPAQQPTFSSATISGLGARNIGSAAMSGRSSAIAGVHEPSGKITLFVGAASGGVWKSDDGGTRYRPVFDEQDVQSIGAISIDPSNGKNVWVGTGESWTRNSVAIGDGIYKSSDGGETWNHVGLEKSERIGRIAVTPGKSDTVFAAVPGALWSDSADRGLYKTSDGGKTWKQVLKGANLSTGCTDVAIDPANPNTMFACMWDFRRKGWEYRSGGDGPDKPSASGLFRSNDGGETWTEVTPEANKGFLKKPYGRLAVAIAPSNSKRVYCFVESPASALFVSDDGGATWEQRDKSNWMVWRPFYFARLVVDPKNPDRLFKPDGALILSEDGGKSFAVVGGFQGSHGDDHDVWIDSTNPQTVFAGDDGGMWYSYNGGSKWWKGENLPVSQFYHVSVDDEDPYRVYGGLQDNSSWVGDSQYPGGITNHRWENMYGGDGFWMFPDPADADYIYAEYQGGEIARVNRRTHEARNIKPRPNYNEKLRYNWNTPIALSPNEKGTVYIGAQFLFRSRDHGQNWERISPDLTTNDPQKQKQEQSGGVTVDNSSAEMHTTIYSISESPKDKNLIWVGTDDGNLQVTIDGGKNWAQFKGNHFPAVAVRDLAIQPRENDLVLATHGRGIWIVDDIVPLRNLTNDVTSQDVAFVSARPVQQRIEGSGGWANGDAVFVGDNPPDAAVITYYQKTRHLFGKLRIEILDSAKRVVDEVPASKRSGLNRVTWSMREKPPRVPPAAQIAGAGTRGPRLVPADYTVRLTKAGKAYETKFTVGLDRRAKFTLEDRKAQYDAAMKVHALFNDESALMDRILVLRRDVTKASSTISENDPLKKNIKAFDDKIENVRKKIVATKEGGAITGEERLREHTDQLYGALLSFEGKPGDYQLAYIDALRHELQDVTKDFDQLLTKDLPSLNDSLKSKDQPTISAPPPKVAISETQFGSGTTAIPVLRD